MPDELIATDQPLTEPQRQVLAAVLDTLLPASDDGVMPSAQDLDFVGHLQAQAPDFMPRLTDIVGRFGAGFAGLPLAARVQAIDAFSKEESNLFDALLFEVYACYYQDDDVLLGIGLAKGPPFPRGNSIDPGDLALLDPVIRGSHGYRK